ncbi:FAD-dependent oxidoreductase [Tsukamurella tyrosinosolvens]|uniref:FAD-dependent oxidoreductase n=1 Tax=Tsukamurella tyrosinosolvens TaxID=57704 RepID=UPI00079B55B6|nr:FAD-dependent oxidoreductase [Tsukamurella tyrosinosolvens]KXP07610.1 flavoprotein [Tsukamurella tyrosinosolvens]KZL98813.1 flavoprotein [Tsukamurella tyrosinosolvens]MCA4995037.1 FAD-dependent oxidoreductase [Tsukamurella tyrosinosolvens]RDB46668.1 FAD-dependent oxidoreductase [Tsukamurella tyrosinosolvens]WEL92971.1 FAD-dependent oxidoreductase [Tsukamurella tyrosinosolvens]
MPESRRPVPSATVSTWDFEADVVIAGYGIAGVCAAIEAARAGADVLVLDRTGGWGGAAALSGGWIYLGGGTPLQRALGFEDTAENMETFLTAALGPGVDAAKIHAYAHGSTEHYDWLTGCGVVFKEEFWGEPGWEVPHDEGLGYSGGENAAPFNTVATPAPRGHVPQMADKRTGVRGAGYMLMKPLVETAEALGVRAEYDIRAHALVTGPDGRVEGVVARRFGQDVHVRARRGVVLATGSFAYNAAMIETYAPRLLGRPAAAIEEHDGAGILMAQAVGAALAHMDATEVAFFGDPQMMARGILVNGRGQRFIAEDTYGGRIGQAVLIQQDNAAYLVMDMEAHEEALATETSTPYFRQPPTWAAETVAELESDMGLPAGALTGTVDTYNRHAADGADPLLHKKPQWVRPLDGPVAAWDMRGFTAGFTLGGLRTDADSRVLHVDDAPIPGLFAAGRCTSGVCAGGYASGTSLGDGSFFGRRAGVSAATEQSLDLQ